MSNWRWRLNQTVGKRLRLMLGYAVTRNRFPEASRLTSHAPAGMLHHLDQNSLLYPERVRQHLAPTLITAHGNLDILRQSETLALFCSRKCPGDVILKLYDYARELRQQCATVIGGFHTPMEQECLTILLRGTGNLIICPARSLENMRLPALWKKPLEDGRLLLLSPFAEKHRRVSANSADKRNEFAAALAARIIIAYAEQGGKTEQLAARIVGWRKPLFTFDNPANTNLLKLGAAISASAEWARG
ncbi:MAG: DNA-processing protein DprA [Pyrinomonadaceae bacterium]